MNVVEQLKAAKQLIEKPENWTIDVLARNLLDEQVRYDSPDAVRFCGIGAMARILGLTNLEKSKSFRLLENESIYQFGKFVDAVNDRFGHVAIMKVYDGAIQKCSI